MALFMKQDFTPPVLSRRWIAIKFRPNLLLYNREHIVSILESGLLFREDSADVEQCAPSPEQVWNAAGGGKSGWLTKGERILSVATVAACVAAFPPKSFNRTSIVRLASYLTVPIALRTYHRWLCRSSSLKKLLTHIRDYLTLARRAAACLKESAALHSQLGSVTSVIESTHTMLCRQQSELAIVMSRASSALLGNAPWLKDDVAWAAVSRDNTDEDNLQKIHHAFLVVQSTLLKHIAMAHFIPPPHLQKIYKNHNERIHWIHTVLIERLNDEFKDNYEALDRMYRLLKNYGNTDLNVSKKLGEALKDSWLYSDVHNDIARASLELKLTLSKCTNLDMFLDSCALNKENIDLEVLGRDIDHLIDDITKCLKTAENSQIRLRKLQSKFGGNEPKATVEEEKHINNDETEILKIEDVEPESKDEVFYFIKTDEDNDIIEPAEDITTGPGKKEKETTKVVLNELKRKLVKREDVMRERERQALVKTMPELKDNVPEFPRQIKMEDNIDRKGFISKLRNNITKRSFLKSKKTYKLQSPIKKSWSSRGFKLKINKYKSESDITNPSFEANEKLKTKNQLITVSKDDNHTVITKWCKVTPNANEELDTSDLSEGLSDVESAAINKSVNQAVNEHQNLQNGDAKNFKFTKEDLELTPSSSESDFEDYKEKQMALLNDVRKHRAARKKNHPIKRSSITVEKDVVDESLKPIEYSFGTGMAIASMLQVNNKAKLPNMAQEEVFIGDGEVSEDSGNEDTHL